MDGRWGGVTRLHTQVIPQDLGCGIGATEKLSPREFGALASSGGRCEGTIRSTHQPMSSPRMKRNDGVVSLLATASARTVVRAAIVRRADRPDIQIQTSMVLCHKHETHSIFLQATTGGRRPFVGAAKWRMNSLQSWNDNDWLLTLVLPLRLGSAKEVH